MTYVRSLRTLCVATLVATAALVPIVARSATDRSGNTLHPVRATGLHDARVHTGKLTVRDPQSPTPGSPVSDAAYARMKTAAGTSADTGTTALQGLPRTEPAPATTVTNSFAGISRSTANTFNPPDTIVAKSGLRVLEGVNSVLRMTSTTGAPISRSTLNTFFGAAAANGPVFDPKAYFDRNGVNPRFYVVGLQLAGDGDNVPTNNFSRIWIAVSRSPDPANLASTNWCRYFINGRRNIGTANESWSDFRGLGMGASALTIATNQFQFLPPENFTFAIMRGLSKATISNNASACPAASTIEVDTFQASTTVGSNSAFTIQPVQHYTNPSSFTGTTDPAYFVNSVFGTSPTYRVWQLRNFPGASSVRVVNVTGTFTNTIPPSAPGGSGASLDTGDDRVLQAAGLGDSLTSSNTTGCNFGGGPAEACARIVRFTVGRSATGALTAAINQQQTFGGGAGNFFSYPGVAVNDGLSTAVALQWSSSTRRLTGLLTTKTSAASFTTVDPLTPSGSCLLNTGFDPDKGIFRVGDYTGVQTDSDAVGFWLAAERTASIGGLCQWATQVVRAMT